MHRIQHVKQSATKLIKSKQASKQASKRASKRATKQARKQESEQATKQASKQASNRAPMGCSGFREIPIRISIGSSSYGLRAAISPQVPFTMSVLQMLTSYGRRRVVPRPGVKSAAKNGCDEQPMMAATCQPMVVFTCQPMVVFPGSVTRQPMAVP